MLNAFTYVSHWQAHLQSLLGYSLQSDNYLFSAIASTSALKFEEAMNHSDIEVLLEIAIANSSMLDD